MIRELRGGKYQSENLGYLVRSSDVLGILIDSGGTRFAQGSSKAELYLCLVNHMGLLFWLGMGLCEDRNGTL